MNSNEFIKKKPGRKKKVLTEEPSPVQLQVEVQAQTQAQVHAQTQAPAQAQAQAQAPAQAPAQTQEQAPAQAPAQGQAQVETELEQPLKKKRGRKAKQIENSIQEHNTDTPEEDSSEPVIKIPKKRGRKPKGGKIILDVIAEEANVVIEPNIILHLKCKMSDLENTSMLYSGKNVETFQFEKSKGSDLSYQIIDNIIPDTMITHNSEQSNNETEFKNICNKLNALSYSLHTNNVSDKKSDCFWCTCPFDNPPIYIPQHQLNNIYNCYGCFCSPECATSFLFKEPIDTSTCFERYFLLNNIYGNIYNYTKNIKPAPNPFYTLNKFYGTLSIQEYRKFFKSERLLIVVDKPLSRVFPELQEQNDDIMLNDLTNNTGKYKIKRKSKQNKSDILNEAFNKV